MKELEAALLQDGVAKPSPGSSEKFLGRAISAMSLTLVFLTVVLTCLLFANMNTLREKAPGTLGHISEVSRIVEVDHGVVAADDERCSVVGRNVLYEGGHVVDATVATALCEGVVNPMSSGLGGGSFLLLRLANGKAEAYDMRETAPAAATEDMYANNPSSKQYGALSAGVPGELAGLHFAWQKHGRLPWRRLFEPAVAFADKGFIVFPYLASQIQSSSAYIMSDEGLRQVFAPKGKLLQAGDICHQKVLARTLAAIAEFGPTIFYNGTIGKKLVADVQAAGGILTMEDLRGYRVEVRDPVSADVMGFKIIGMPPPSSGGAGLILILNILASYGTPSALKGILGVHRTIEAFKHMFAVRMNLGDPDFVNIAGVLAEMLSPQFASELQKTIYDNMTFEPEYYGNRWNQLNDHGTCHFGIVDSNRNAVAMTTTVNYPFGAKLLSLSTGIILNNEMDDFSVPSDNAPGSLPPAVANFIRPNKRPLSSMSPTIILQNGQLRGVLGASGGMKIIPATAQVFLNYFVKGMDPLYAVTSARVYHKLTPNIVNYENWTVVTGEHIEVPRNIREGLQNKGHKLKGQNSGAISQLIVHDLKVPANMGKIGTLNKDVYYGKLTAVCDLRKDGGPAGF